MMEIVGRAVLKADNVNEHDAADIVCDEECKPVIATLHVRRHRCPTSLAENTSVGCLADSRRTCQTLIRCSAAAAGSIAAISAKGSATNGTRTPMDQEAAASVAMALRIYNES